MAALLWCWWIIERMYIRRTKYNSLRRSGRMLCWSLELCIIILSASCMSLEAKWSFCHDWSRHPHPIAIESSGGGSAKGNWWLSGWRCQLVYSRPRLKCRQMVRVVPLKRRAINLLSDRILSPGPVPSISPLFCKDDIGTFLAFKREKNLNLIISRTVCPWHSPDSNL